jgi:cytochrome b561
MTATPRYDRVAQLLHWLIAALAVAAVTLGIVIGLLPRGGAARETVLLLHRSVGLTIFAAMVLRLLWRLGHKPPPLPPSLKPVEVVLAKSVHIVLYLLFFLMPVAGYVNAAAAGHAVSFFGLASIPPLLPLDLRVAQIAIALHLAGQFLIYLFVGLHSAAALLHALRRDGVMARMLPGLR